MGIALYSKSVNDCISEANSGSFMITGDEKNKRLRNVRNALPHYMRL